MNVSRVINYLFILLLFLFPIEIVAEGGSNNPQVTITPSSKSVTEGDSGTNTITFTVSINECPNVSDIKVKVNTTNGSANSGSDYIAINENITFHTGSGCQKDYDIGVEVNGDTEVESDETFNLILSDNGTIDAQNFTWGNQNATATILNDDNTIEEKEADLSITKDHEIDRGFFGNLLNNSDKAVVGDTIEYTIIAKNSGPDKSKIRVVDRLPDGLDFDSVSVSPSYYDFSCRYYSGGNSIVCNGDEEFNSGDSVEITLYTKVNDDATNTITNKAEVSIDSDNVTDPNTDNNIAEDQLEVALTDIKVDKTVQREGTWTDYLDTAHVGDTLKFKIEIENIGEVPNEINFEDVFPSALVIQNGSLGVNKNFSTSYWDTYDCRIDTNENKLICEGNHEFEGSDKVTLYLSAQVTEEGVFTNGVWLEPETTDADLSNNWSDATVAVNRSGERPINFTKTVSPPSNGEYITDDIVTFTISGEVSGTSREVMVRDFFKKYGTTPNAFEYISATSDQLECSLKNQGQEYERLECVSTGVMNAGDNFNITLKVKLLKAGNVCNNAHFYKLYPVSWGEDWRWLDAADVCFNVEARKMPPILEPEDFHFKLNVEDSVDLKDYTTDPDTDKSDLTYTITGLPDGLSMTNDGTISGKYTDETGTFPKEFNVTATVTDPDGLSDTKTFKIIIDAPKIKAYNNLYSLPINSDLSGNVITDPKDSQHPRKKDKGKNLRLISVTPQDANLTWSSDGSFSYHTPTAPGLYKFTYTIEDKYGQTDSAKIKIDVYKPDIKANDDILEVAINTPLHSNVFADNGNGVDVGDDIKIIDHTNPQHGTLTLQEDGSLVYTPNINYVGDDSFIYTIQDKYGQTEQATVYLTIGVMNIEGYADFSLVNPPDTRNLVGNYLVAGNTVTCITEKRGDSNEIDTFNGTCQNSRSLVNNNYVVKYIDVDSDPSTWNSSSAKITLPDSYLDLEDGSAIAWAGLFWQGGVNNKNDFKQRRAYRDGSSYSYFTTDRSPVVISNTDANRVLIKIDNNVTYTEVESNTLYYDRALNQYGGYYAAYANITEFMQNAHLRKGEHTITVANITTNEGRESQVGNYGGWSIVIIYKEGITGKPRNVSIYNGYQPLGFGGSTNIPSKELIISGFRLPKAIDSNVDAKMSAFVGEGEEAYGGSSIVYDKMYIKDINANHIYDMPVTHPNNIFDSKIDNDQSEAIPNRENTNGVDVDSYDVSDIIKDIRDKKPDTSKIVIGLASEDLNNSRVPQSDYVTASMIAFSTQLYAPKMCYDYNIRIGDYINIPSVDRNFTVSQYADKPLRLNILLRSQEADFDLIKTKLSAKFDPNNSFEYRENESLYSPPNTVAYLPAIDTNVDIGQIAIGRDVTIDGGIIGANETTYAKLYYDFLRDDFSGKFDIDVEAKISFDDINEVPYTMSTDAPPKSIFRIDRCNINPVYDPVYGIINVERGDSTFDQPEPERYSLYTQVTGVPYEISVAAYQKDANGKYTQPNTSLHTDVEVELIDAGTMENNSSEGFDSVCRNPESYSRGVMVSFNGDSRKTLKIPDDYPTYPSNRAVKNAAFRTWVLTRDNNGTREVINYHCNSSGGWTSMFFGIPGIKNACYKMVYAEYYAKPGQEDFKNGYCQIACASDISDDGNGCYDCLRQHYGVPICSRDNFAIRPDSYSMEISDINQTKGNPKLPVGKNDGANSKHLSAGYTYNLDINATMYPSINRDNVLGYYFASDDSNNSKRVANATFLSSSGTNCPDTNNHKLNISMYDGQTIGIGDINSTQITRNGFVVNNVGNYMLHLEDSYWTEVDQEGYPYKPFSNRADCIANSNDAKNGQDNAKRGCVIKTGTGANLPDLPVTLHPYKFNLENITVTANPNSNSNYLYIANIDRIKDQVDSGNLMALNISGGIKAIGKNGASLTNYVNGCMAKDLDVVVSYKTDPENNVTSLLGGDIPLQYYLYDSSVDTTLPITQSKSNINAQESFDVTFNKKYFYRPATGSFNTYMNLGRRFNNAINPFNFTTTEFNVTSPTETMTVDMVSNHKPTAKRDLNVTKTFYYARVKSKVNFYDDIYEDSVKTPIEVTRFCNTDLAYCAKYGINIDKDGTNEYDWWVAREHNATIEGKALLEVSQYRDIEAPNKINITPTTIENFIYGIDENVIVSKQSIADDEYPYTFYIKPTAGMVSSYPYLLFNRDNDSVSGSYSIFGGRFVKPGAAWSGKGQTGFVTDFNSTGRKTKKVDW